MQNDDLDGWHVIDNTPLQISQSSPVVEPECDNTEPEQCMNSSKWAIVLGTTTLAVAGALVHIGTRKR